MQAVAPGAAMTGKKMPMGVKVVAVLDYIGAGIALLFGLLLLFGGSFFSKVGGGMGDQFGWISALGGGFFLLFGIILLPFAVLGFFIGRGLWKGQNWARILTIIFMVLGVLSAIGSIAGGKGGYFQLILDAVIGGYLWFAPEVKQAFAK